MSRQRTVSLALVLAMGLTWGIPMNGTAADDPRAGEAVYNQTCVACHGENGKGEFPGVPDLSRDDGVLTQSDEILLKHLLHGFQSPGSPMAMPAKGGNDDLTIKNLRDVLIYLHQKFHYKSYD